MLNKNQKAEKLFNEYRNRVEKSVAFYNRLQMHTPGYSYPTIAKKIWREGILAEMWAILATKLSRDKIDYLQNWRTGK